MKTDAPLLMCREPLFTLYEAAMDAVLGQRVVARYLSARPINPPIYLLAIGKAATSMAQGAMQIIPRVAGGLVVSKYGHLDGLPLGLDGIEAGHPVPDQNSLQAGQRVIDFVRSIPRDGTLVALLSGGASSLVECLPDPLCLDDLQRINRWLLASGLDILAINSIRKRLSSVKGGRLASYFSGKKLIGLLLSDVPGDDPAVIGSGLFSPDINPVELNTQQLPEFVRNALHYTLPPIGAQAECFKVVTLDVVANLTMALDAIERAAKAMKFCVTRQHPRLQGDVRCAAQLISRVLRESVAGIHLWGGELSVQLPDHPGRGGRCQSLALQIANELKGEGGWCLLAAGTDGGDGPGKDAGALVDGQTIIRAKQVLGDSIQIEEYLQRANAGTVLAASGDLIVTGPTGTNVTDLVIACRLGHH